jgi:Carboxypeptidase regulatory-like domain
MVLIRAFARVLAAAAIAASAAGQSARTPAAPCPGTAHLSRAEYDRLKDEAARSAEEARTERQEPPPSVKSAIYTFRATARAATIDLNLDIIVRPPGRQARLALPPTGAIDQLTDRGPAPVAVLIDADHPILRFSRPGRYNVSLRAFPEEHTEAESRAYTWTTISASSARLTATTTLSGGQLEWLPAAGGSIEVLAAGISRPIPAGQSMTIRVRTPGRVGAALEKPVVSVETADVVRVDRERLWLRTVMRIVSSRAPLNELRIEIDPAVRPISVDGPGDVQLVPTELAGHVLLKFGDAVQGETYLSLLASRPLPSDDTEVELTATRVPSAASSRGWVLLEPAPLRRFEHKPEKDLERTDILDLPVFAQSFAESGTVAYRVRETGAGQMIFHAPLRQITPSAETVVREESILTIIGDRNNRTDRHRLTIETRRSFFSEPIAPGQEIVSVSVDGTPVTPRRNGGDLVIVLPPRESPFRAVEIVTRSGEAPLPRRGELILTTSATPEIASLATWTVVLPEDHRYRYVSSSGVRMIGWSLDQGGAILQNYAAGWLSASYGAVPISGRISDTSGGALPGVRVELRNLDNPGWVRIAFTNTRGEYEFSSIPAGRYRVEATLQGFQTVRAEVNGVGVGLVENIQMTLASTAEQVTVSSEAPLLDTRKTTTGSTYRLAEPVSPPPPREPARAGAPAFAPAEGSQAGIRSLPISAVGHGKRLILSGPLVGTGPLSVTLRVKPN